MSEVAAKVNNPDFGIDEKKSNTPSDSALDFSVDDMLTMDQVCTRFGLSEPPVRYRMKAGLLHPIKFKKPGSRGRARLYFHRQEIEEELERINALRKRSPGTVADIAKPNKKIITTPNIIPNNTEPQQVGLQIKKPAAANDGEKCSQAVRLFREGKTQLDLVIEMSIDFDTAQYFWDAYRKAQPCWLLPQRQFAQIRCLLGWDEDKPTTQGFERALHAYIAKQAGEDGSQPITPEEQKSLDEIPQNE